MRFMSLRLEKLPIARSFDCQGKARLDRKIANYNRAARHGRWLVLRDMDSYSGCPAEMRNGLLHEPSEGMHLRIVVRGLEAWMLGDAKAFSAFFKVPTAAIPPRPEELPNPKSTVLSIVNRSRSREIKTDMLPRANSGAHIGPAYTMRLRDYARHAWRPRIAAESCDSLRRCLRRLELWLQ